MKRIYSHQQQPLTQKQRFKAQLQPFIKIRKSLSNVGVSASDTIKLLAATVKEIDSYFFDEESAGIRPYFYGSLAFSILVTVAVYLMIL